MDATFEKLTFKKRLKTMLKVDFKRMFTMPLIYIMAGVSLAMPILILVMTSLMGGEPDPTTGAEAAAMFTNVWQAISSVSGAESSVGASMAMDLTTMCNMNLMYFMIAVLVCVFTAEDFRSGYAKNLFTVRSKKVDYVFSKTLVCFVGGTIMMLMFFIGAMIGGGIAGLPFTMEGFNAGEIVACLFSKIFLVAVFVAIFLTFAIVAKQRTWLSILLAIGVGAFMFMMIPIMTPINATFLHVIMTLAGGGLFAVGLGAVSNVI
ncbi:MAG: ABC transporter permease, partial [Clostridiales bacterium]|nr:ABC transporter permease [Clostridiales bacterium]